ncbi:MAG: UDP-N-acetylmuramoyl-L-alanine--D-glutamate ligase [Eubacteriales bacterium]|nr:UDP-N-acetylmuramoyl-L-alanine--D-glutamate ligase [Eubacteriales bacterium]
MNEKLKEFYDRISGKKVAVIGIGISNKPLIVFLLKHGATVKAYDKKTKEKLGEIYNELSSLGVEFCLGEGYLDEISEDIIFKTPGMRYDVPALCNARKRGAWVTSEMEVFFDVCPAKIIAVTGSDGKTTTTTLIHKFLEASGYITRLGGNIGRPLIGEIEEISADEWIVLELSSFQLHTMRKSPDIAVITNITPNHLDWHTDYNEYIEAKKNIISYQTKDSLAVLNSHNEETKAIIPNCNGKVRSFSAYCEADFMLKDGIICKGDEQLLDSSDIKIPGMHNVENYMTAIAAVYDLVNKSVFTDVARSFGGVPHRIEFIRTIDGVKYYNSSIDSSPNRSLNTLSVFGNNVVMIAGGKDKGIAYDDIGPAIVQHVKTLILIGMTSDKIEQAVRNANGGDKVKIIRASDYPNAVLLAKNEAVSGDVVILSPASTSFDMFNNFEERGNLFKEIVLSL